MIIVSFTLTPALGSKIHSHNTLFKKVSWKVRSKSIHTISSGHTNENRKGAISFWLLDTNGYFISIQRGYGQ
jgi:hypothetical protein